MTFPISIEDMSKQRTVEEYIDWFALAEQKINSRKDWIKATRLGKPIEAKKFREEAAALNLFFKKCSRLSRETLIQHCTGNQPYDARLKIDFDSSFHNLDFLEIVSSKYDEEYKSRMRFLNQEGSVNLYTTVSKKGTKHKGLQIDIANEAVNTTDVVEKVLSTIRSRVENKFSKKYKENTGLLVSFDDFVFIDRVDEDHLWQVFNKEYFSSLRGFSWVFFVGDCGCIYKEFRLDASRS